ncbi:MAG: nuclear transport factor 2 family protein [Crocinitomicaceae bacterium]|nr:nuclear transport factor 2 family protein [Crocinitomicaceae bacterium]
MQHEPQQIITEFYQAFKDLDAEKMISFYSYNVIFEDPAFGRLNGERAANMWRMLIESQKGKDFVVEFSHVTENSAHWEAHYTFSQTGRKVHNIISAQFEIQNGKITKHTDHFNLHAWAKQALGFKGWLLGGTRFFQKKLQAQTNRLLDKFEGK